MTAVAVSTRGYIGDIGSPHDRHFPLSSNHEMTGMLSRAWSAAPQRGQRDRGLTTDCFGSAPQREMQTLRKLPSTSPSTAANAITTPAGTSVTQHLIEQDCSGGADAQRLGTFRQGDRHPPRRSGTDGVTYARTFVANYQRHAGCTRS